MVCGCFISTARWKYGLFPQFSPWRAPRIRHFAGYSFKISRKKASAIFYNTALFLNSKASYLKGLATIAEHTGQASDKGEGRITASSKYSLALACQQIASKTLLMSAKEKAQNGLSFHHAVETKIRHPLTEKAKMLRGGKDGSVGHFPSPKASPPHFQNLFPS